MASKKCMALYDYTGRDGEELTVKKNEKLTVVDNQGTWWKVKNESGREGLVPSNYVQVTAANNSRSDIKDGPGMYQQTDLIPAKQPSLNILAVAKFNYQATNEDELDLKKGEEIIVMEKEADGWWRGRCGTKIGWFPFNYVEEKADNPPPSMPGAGAIATPPAAEKPKEKAFICGVIALYSFNSGNPEELQFEKGDLMDIIDQPSDDPDWWEARKTDGTIGLVPRNYVEVVHDAEPVFGKTSTPTRGGGPPAPGGSQATAGGLAPPPFAHESWFYGKMARREAENILNTRAQNGQFIVRASETKVSVCVSVAV